MEEEKRKHRRERKGKGGLSNLGGLVRVSASREIPVLPPSSPFSPLPSRLSHSVWFCYLR
jgi:hypothetical protein